jgi:hypothetical protein
MEIDLFTAHLFHRPKPVIPEHVQRLSAITPGSCVICRRRAGPQGYAPLGYPTLWFCHDDDCKQIVSSGWIFKMSSADFNEIERDALTASAKLGMQYLKSIGKADVPLAHLEPSEAFEFLERVVDGFGSYIRHRMTVYVNTPEALADIPFGDRHG